MSYVVSLALPTVRPFFNPLAHDDCIADLVAASQRLTTVDPHLLRADISVSYFSEPETHPLVQGKWAARPATCEFGLLVFAADLTAHATALRADICADGRSRSAAEVEALIGSLACENFEFEISNLLLLANIWRPGALTTTSGFAYCNEQHVGAAPAFHAEGWYRAADVAAKYKWPELNPGSVAVAWAWLAAAACIEDGIAKGPLGRALAALSYVASEGPNAEDDSLNLVWVLLALEALYCHGNVGLREQLVSKSELVLGPRVENKRAFGAMYDFRSRLLHGDMDLPMRYSRFNAVPAFEQHYDDLSDHEGLGLAALIATLQTMIRNNWRSLTFSYEVQGVPNPHARAT
jgi:hypothetical protein